MTLEKLFNAGAAKLKELVRRNDLLAVEKLIVTLGRRKIADALDVALAKAITPAMAAVMSGPNGAIGHSREVQAANVVTRPQMYLKLMYALLQAKNIGALDVIIRKEKDHFNGGHGTQVMETILEGPIDPADKRRYLSIVLAGGHNRMIYPQRAFGFAAARHINVADLFGGPASTPQRAPLVIPQPTGTYA